MESSGLGNIRPADPLEKTGEIRIASLLTRRKDFELEEVVPPVVPERFETRVAGTGHCLPKRIVPNAEFEDMPNLDTSDEWIRTRTGIHQRHFAAETDRTSHLAAEAGRKALDAAGIPPAELDAIIVSTNTPDMRLPATANFVQRQIGADNAYAYDIGAACSGFVFAMGSAHAHIQAGFARHVLVIGAEVYSSILDFTDRTTCVLFGDGAGAVVLEKKKPEHATIPSGVLAVSLYSQGEYTEILQCEGSGTADRTMLRAADAGEIRMNGKMVFKLAIEGVTRASRDVLRKAGLDIGHVDWLIPHQANIRIIENIAKVLGCPPEKVVVNVDRVGNTSSASVPIAMDEAVRDGRIRKGQLVLLGAVGAGLSSGAVLLRV